MTKRKMPKGLEARRRFQMKYPRTVDKLHGLTQVDDLFEGTEPPNVERPETRDKRR